MTTATAMPAVIGWKFGTQWGESFSATNEEVCNAFGVKVPQWLDEDYAELLDACWDKRTNWGSNDNFAGVCCAITLAQNGCYDKDFPDLKSAYYFDLGVWETMNETTDTMDSVLVYWDTTRTDFTAVKELFLTAVKQTADDYKVPEKDYNKWVKKNANNIRIDFTNKAVA
jgi:hypothetical protein